MKIRRVVTGHTADRRSTVASDEKVEPITVALAPGSEFHRLWGADAAPTYPDDGAPLLHHSYFPAAGGFRFVAFTLPPSTAAAPPDLDDVQAAMSEAEAKLPGLLGYMEPDNPGFHTTDTIDMSVVTSGEIVLRLDNGEETVLRAGDTFVQSGTRHAWRNDGSVPATLVVAIVGARRA